MILLCACLQTCCTVICCDCDRTVGSADSGDDEGSEEEAPRPSQRRARGAGGGGRKRKQPDAGGPALVASLP